MPTLARVDGNDLTLTGLLWRRRPRVLAGGVELPRDARGTYQLTGQDGVTRPLRAKYDLVQMGPVVRFGDELVHVGRPLPAAVRIALVVFALLGLVAGGVGFVLFACAALGSAALLRRNDRTGLHVAAAVALPVAAVVVYLVVVLLIAAGAFL